MSTDELAEINGIRPNKLLADGDEVEVRSRTSKSVYKVKRTWDHYYCTCPAWRNQARAPVDARSCKHIRTLMGDTYEDARLARKRSDGDASEDKVKALKEPKPASKANKRKRSHDDEDVDEDEGTVNKKSTNVGRSGSSKKPKEENEEEDNEDNEQGKANEERGKTTVKNEEDELAEINGIKPKKYLADGDQVEVKSMTSDSVYKIKRTWDHYYCTCPAWRNQARVPVDARSCKHIRSLLGDAYENARSELKNPGGVAQKPTTKGKKRASKASKKTRTDNEDDNEGEDDTGTSAAPPLLLANSWKIDGGQDVTGWWMSEKLDGVRVFYDGKQMLSRLGNPFTPSKELLRKLPKDVTLDGELFGGRGKFSETVSIVKTRNSQRWASITFEIFDVPSKGDLPFEDRMKFLETLFGPSGSHADPAFHIVEQTQVEDKDHAVKALKDIESKGGEGLMLRRPGSVYEGKRSSSLLKLKTFYDAEARVTGYEPGKGRNKGVTGSLKCVMASGKTFNVGSGLSDKQRNRPPKVGSIIVYRFQELTRDGVPRFPTFIGESADKTVPKDAEVPEHRKTGVPGPDDV